MVCKTSSDLTTKLAVKLILFLSVSYQCFGMQLPPLSQEELRAGQRLIGAARMADTKELYSAEIELKKLLLANPHLNLASICDANGKTPLMLLACGQARRIINPLMTLMSWDVYRNAVLNVKDNSQRAALHYAVDRAEVEDALEIAEVLCAPTVGGDQEIDINSTTQHGENALTLILSQLRRAESFYRLHDEGSQKKIDRFKKVESLFELLRSKGINVDHQNEDGSTALMQAAFDSEATRLLLTFTPDVNLMDKRGKTALMYAVGWLKRNEDEATSVINLLLKRGANIEEIYPILQAGAPNTIVSRFFSLLKGNTSDNLYNNRRFFEENIADQVNSDNPESVELLCQNVSKFSPEMLANIFAEAIKNSRLKAARVLLSMKNSQRRFLVLPPSKNFSTHRALLNAVSNDSRESVDLILDDDKSNLNGFDSVGQNPLLFAIEGEKFEAASALVKQGASITICDANGENAVMKLVTYASAKVGAIDSRSLTKEFREEALKPFRDLFVVDTSVELDGLSLTRAICKKDKAGKTIYDLATDEGVRDECRDMVRRQFDMVFQDSLREPLRMRLKAMKLLIETHGELLDSDRLFGRDPISPNYLRRALLHSSAHGSNEVVKVILDSGKVDINYQPQLTDVVPGPTALMSAAVEGQLATVKMLCSRGAKVVAVGSLEEGKNLKTARQHVIEKINQLKAAGQETDSYGEIEKYLSEYAARKVSRRASVELMERNELLEALVAEKEKEIKKLKDPVPAD